MHYTIGPWEGGGVERGFNPLSTSCSQRGEGGGTVCSNGFYAEISNHLQMQKYKSCLKSFLSNFGSFEVHTIDAHEPISLTPTFLDA